MDINEAKQRLVRWAIQFEVGGFRPEENLDASWFGRVNLAAPGEKLAFACVPSERISCAALADDYYDHFENVGGLKIGGWPTLIQSEIYWAPWNKHPAAPRYVFQIDSTDKGTWMWGDGGVGYFGRETAEGHESDWACEWQCY